MIILAMPLAGQAAERQFLHGHVPAAISRLAPLGRLEAAQHMHLAIALPLRNQQSLANLLSQIYDPDSSNFRHYLTPAQFAAQFGPTTQDYEAVATFATAHGLTVANRYSNRVLLDVEGAVPDIERALHVTMRVYRHPMEDRIFYAPDVEPSLDLAVPIAHIGGLDNYSLPKPHFHRMPARRAQGPVSNIGSGPGGTYMGTDFRAAYIPGVLLTGSGQKLGLLEFNGYSAGDITYYENLAGLPTVPLINERIDHYSGRGSGDGEVEVSLDIEVAISMAPALSEIIVYEASPNGIFDDILNRMVTDNSAKVLSCSWSVSGQGDDPVADGIFQQMATQGQSFFCASGDSDAYTGSIPFPCDNPYITLVGGTTLTDSGTGGAWSSETAWNWGYDSSAGGYVGSSGGISTQYSIPTWQQSVSVVTNGGSTKMRNVPDVAMTADQVYVRVAGGNENVGGTSCASPLWAALTALVNQQAAAHGKSTVGFINTVLYQIGTAAARYTSDFHDITTGNNTSSSSPNQFYAVAGYDLCTGWGTPAGAGLINSLAVPNEEMQVSTSSFVSSGSAGGPFTPSTKTYTLTNLGTSQLTWKASATQSWLSLSATSGSLAASGSSMITASVNANAAVLASGTYSDTITFTDSNTDFTQPEPVSLGIAIAAPVITSTLTAMATTGQAFSYQITATNNPTSYNATGLPAGLGVNTATGLISGTATGSGSNYVTISAANTAGSGSALLSILVQTPYAIWQGEVFSASELANPAISGDTAEPAGDGIPNLMKYALNLDPWTNGASGLPVGCIATTGSGNYLTLNYTQVISATDISYTVQVSTDLQTWNSGPGWTTTPSATNNADGVTQAVTVQDVTPVSSNTPSQFIRLQVTRP